MVRGIVAWYLERKPSKLDGFLLPTSRNIQPQAFWIRSC